MCGTLCHEQRMRRLYTHLEIDQPLSCLMFYSKYEKLADNKKRTVSIGLVTLEEDTTIQQGLAALNCLGSFVIADATTVCIITISWGKI